MYSHYEGQNHVRAGGKTKLYQSLFSLTVYNPADFQQTIRELKIICTINGVPHPFQLFDNAVQGWEENYNLPAHTVSTFSWVGVPEGHGILPGSPGMLAVALNDGIGFHFSYIQQNGKCHEIPIPTVERHRLHPDQIAVS